MRKPDYRKCLVLDSGYMPRQIITSERAFVVSLKGNANIIHNHPEKFGLVNPDLEIYRPSVIVVPKYINTHFYKLPPTRDNIFKRDDYTCVYCGYNDMRAMWSDARDASRNRKNRSFNMRVIVIALILVLIFFFIIDFDFSIFRRK